MFKNTFVFPTILILAVLSLFLGLSILFGIAAGFVLASTLLLTFQALIALTWKTFSWLHPDQAKQYQSPEVFETPQKCFSLLLPARHEAEVIKDTIRAISQLNYPTHLFEVLLILRDDDHETIQAAHDTIAELRQSNVNIRTFSEGAYHKSAHLNQGLYHTSHDVIGIFDAEDEPHPDILNIINTTMVRTDADVVQSGVQLMDVHSSWYSLFNVLEYFFWFRSGLIWFTKHAGACPLGGNTVFVKRDAILSVGGWSETCLTEDAHLGLELAKAGAKFEVIYDPIHATQEETPHTMNSFVKQRTRWIQGFMQILGSLSWAQLPSIEQKLLFVYVLSQSLLQTLFTSLSIVLITVSLFVSLPLWVSLLSFIPAYLLIMLIISEALGLYEFGVIYKKKIGIKQYLLVAVGYIAYSLVIGFATIRAFKRLWSSQQSWEKTAHTNAHRNTTQVLTT